MANAQMHKGERGDFNLLDGRKDIARKRITCVYQNPAIYSWNILPV